MDTATIALLSPFMLMGLIMFISGLALIGKVWGRFVTGTVKPGEIGQFCSEVGLTFELITSLGMAFVWAMILGVPALIISGGILIAIIDGVFGTDLVGIVGRLGQS